jgi:DNA-binding transcriptional ArsR family regulator
VQEVLIKALNHPIRREALTILTERIASPKEAAHLLDVKLSSAAYHLRVLADLGLIELVEEKSVRGAVQHFYKAVERPVEANPVWNTLDPKVRNAFSGYLFETLISDVAKSLSAEIFDRREDRHLKRIPLLLDDKGWREVGEIHQEANDKILKVQAAVRERLNGASGDPIHSIAAMLLFEVPPGTDD